MPLVETQMLVADMVEKKIPVSSYISGETWTALLEEAREARWSISQLIRVILEEHLNKRPPKKRPKT
jgi:hypothetical protein